MTYTVKEIFKTLQGEGAQSGRPAVFCRFTGCNLWSGREQDRGTAICQFCDTDFVGTDGPGGGRFASAADLAQAIGQAWASEQAWASDTSRRFVVFTGGEPLLQLDPDLIEAVHRLGFEIAVETNGTQEARDGIDWICVSPKAGAPLKQTSGHELKLVYPQRGIDPADLVDLSFNHFWLQPMDGPDRAANTAAAIAYCLAHPHWRLSVQMHKLVGIP
jgi:7-carboxy-7-deazaguanine synthase (Cx14CxxC type)